MIFQEQGTIHFLRQRWTTCGFIADDIITKSEVLKLKRWERKQTDHQM